MAAGRDPRVDTTVVDGLDNTIGALLRSFSGANAGKMLVRLNPEPAT